MLNPAVDLAEEQNMGTATGTPGRVERSTRMQLAFRHAPIAGLVADPSGRVEAANLAATKLFGRPESELVGCELSALMSHVEHAPSEGRDDVASVHVGHLTDGSVVVQIAEGTDVDTTGATVAEQRAFRSALLELSELSHTQIDDSEFYDTLIERAVGVVPGAQAGSILVRRPGTDEYHFVAALGFDLTALQQGHLLQSEMFRDLDTPIAAITQHVSEMHLSPDLDVWFASAGRIRDIVVNVSAPVFIGDDPAAFISLDNFDDAGAFNATSVEMTTVLGRLIADLLRRRELETELRRERESFRHLALHDGLTGLANRRQIEAALADTVAACVLHETPLAVLFVDLDDFKGVNDVHGHDAGDQVLVAVATALRLGTRSGDVVGRWGGDEFIVIAPSVTARSDVRAIAERVLSEFDGNVELTNGRSLPCRLSIGAVWSADGSEGSAGLVRRADEALYEAKQSGKGTVRVADE